MAKVVRSIEELVEDCAKKQLSGVKYYTKTETINNEIEKALKDAPSKSGGTGANIPDIKLFIQTKSMRHIPVMIEIKGKKGAFIKLNADDEIDNKKKDGSENFANINKYAVNGAIHYANAIINYSSSYKEAIAIGMNGYYDEGNSLISEIGVYYVSLDNFCIPKKVGNYTDLTFLLKKNQASFVDAIDKLGLTNEEVEAKTREYENQIEINLKKLNQTMHDTLNISVGSRVSLITGMIMAGLGVEGKIAPLKIEELKGETGRKTHDGRILINKIDSFLEERNLPQEKKEMIINDLSRVFIYSELWKPQNGESKLKTVYSIVHNDIMPIFTSAKHLDFTGKLFNILNAWVDIPDSDKNDVVLTPRYVTELMAKLARVNMDSYVWDYAVGSAGFLISSMKLMIKDAQNRINSPEELKKKIRLIKETQLLGIEKRSDIYLLAVLNMILMGDGSSNIIHKDSLTEFEGIYEQGELNGEHFPANVFLLNPPYSAPGKGFIFVEKALSRMKNGRAVVLIQENAGSKNGTPYTANILKNNTLVASIHMADIFKGKAGVQTAIYVLDIGIPHNPKQKVKFIDFSNDGYSRLSRKKASQSANLKNTDHAYERYEEIVNLVLYGKEYLYYFSENEYIEDTISLTGCDWTFRQHKKINTVPTVEDYRYVIKKFYGWKISAILNGDVKENLSILTNLKLNEKEKSAIKKYNENTFSTCSKKISEFFIPSTGDTDIQKNHINGVGNFVVTSGVDNYGIAGKSDVGAKIITENAVTIDMFGNAFFRSIPYKMVTHARVFTISKQQSPMFVEEGLYLTTQLFYFNQIFGYDEMASWEKIKDIEIKFPINSAGEIDYDFIKHFVTAQIKNVLSGLIGEE